MLDFTQNAIPVNLAIFTAAAVLVWWAGTKLSVHVDLYADRTGMGRAFAGALLLGGATCLPELATSVTASYSGAAALSGNNLLGGIAMQVAVLAAIDAVVLRGQPLTLFAPKASLLMMGVMQIGLVALASAAISSGEFFSIWNVGLWPVSLVVAYVASIWVIQRYEERAAWEPTGEIVTPPESATDLNRANQERYRETSNAGLVGYFLLAAAGVLVGGFLVARTGEALATQTGLSQGFVGATLVSITTSLPEVSTTWAAVRFGAYSMAMANILGSNSITIALFFPADLFYREGLIMDELGAPENFLAAIGIVATTFFLWGMLERRDRTLFGIGHDSVAVLTVYFVGMTLYYFL